MSKYVFGGIIALSIIVSLIIAGCRQDAAASANPSAVGDNAAPPANPPKRSVGAVLKEIGSAPAAAIVSDHLKPFFAAGLGLIVLGALTFAFGGKGSAGALVAIGVFTVWTGTSIIQYPYVTLLAPLAIAGILVFIMRDMWKARKAAAVEVEAVEEAPNKKEITSAIKEQGPDVERLVRWLVDPIKALLRKGEGSGNTSKSSA